MNEPILKLKYPFEIAEIDGEALAVEEGIGNFNGIIKLQNDTARFIFDKLRDGTTVSGLLTACTKEYNCDSEDEILPMITEFVDALKNAGIVTEL